MIDTFEKSLIDDSPIYYHYLTDYISLEYNTYYSICSTFIKTNEITAVKMYNYSLDDLSTITLDDGSFSQNMNIDFFLRNIDYCILYDINGLFSIYKKDDDTHILFFEYDSVINDIYCVPYFGYTFKQTEIDKIKTILYLNTLYRLLSCDETDKFVLEKLVMEYIEIYNERMSRFDKTYYPTNIDYIKQIIHHIQSVAQIDILSILSKNECTYYISYNTFTNFTDFYDYITNPDQSIKFSQKFVHYRPNFYELIKDFAKEANMISFDINTLKIQNMDNFDIQIKKIESNQSINEKIYNTIKVHYINNNYYVYKLLPHAPKWFSTYWSILFHAIFNQNKQLYESTINNIHQICINKINKIFCKDLFKKMLLNGSSSIYTMVNLWNKYISIGILDHKNKADFRNIRDYLSDEIFDIRPQINDLSQIFDNEDIHEINELFKKKPHEILERYFANYKTKQFTRDICRQDSNTSFMFMYKLFCYNRNNNIAFFNNINKIDLDRIINEYTQNGKDTHVTYAILLLEKYGEIANLDETNLPEYDFIIKYYFNAKYIYGLCNKYAKYDNTHISNVDLNDNTNMNLFCIFLHKFELYIYCLYNVQTYGMSFDYRFGEVVHKIFFENWPPIDQSTQFQNVDKCLYLNAYFPPPLFEIFPPTYHFMHDAPYSQFKIEILQQIIDHYLKNPSLLYEPPNGINVYKYIVNYLIFDIKNNESIRNNMLAFWCIEYLKIRKNNTRKEYTRIDPYLEPCYEYILRFFLAFFCDYNCHTYSHDNDLGIGEDIYTYLHLSKIDIYSQNNMQTRFKNIQSRENFERYESDISEFADNDDIQVHVVMFILEHGYNKHKKDTTPDNFINYISNVILRNDIVFQKEIISKYLPKTTFNKNIITLPNDNSNYYLIEMKSTYTQLFNNPMCSITNDDKSIYYMFYDTFYLKFIKIGSSYKIYVDENETYNDSDINLPFIKLLSYNCVHLIYIKNNIYHIRYFINNSESPSDILGYYYKEFSNLLTINPNNLFFYNTSNTDEIIDIIIPNYGVYYLNNIYAKETIEGLYLLNKKTIDLYPKINFVEYLKQINYKKINFINNTSNPLSINLINKQTSYINIINKKKITEPQLNSYIKLLKKIKNCEITDANLIYIREKLTKIIEKCDTNLQDFMKYLDKDYTKLFDNYDKLYNYLLHVKIKNTCNTLLTTDKHNLCGQIKIYEDRFNIKINQYKYIFEAFFEFYLGIELTDEQFDRYTDIISKYETYIKKQFNKYQLKTYDESIDIIDASYKNTDLDYIQNKYHIGGTMTYPLHHFMMGKGKSAVLTPLLTIYFALIHKLIVYIIVPEHLKKQTIATINTLSKIFNIEDNINVVSDSDIKNKFLEGYFNNLTPTQKSSHIFLIDEFDSLLDPLKSNYNVVNKYIINKSENLYILMNDLVDQFIKNDKLTNFIDNYNTPNFKYYNEDSLKIIKHLTNNYLKLNINWGIHPTKCYAIPFANKDKPLIESNFSSIMMTIFLTLYYYKINKDYDRLIIFIYGNETGNHLFQKDIIAMKKKLLLDDVYNETVKSIINTINIADTQLNTSFVDIINIDHIYKIGYSGNVNVILPELENNFSQNNIIYDYDEQTNVNHAINHSKIIKFKNNYKYNSNFENTSGFLNEIVAKKYDVLIDEAGLFKNINNNIVAEKLYELCKDRPIIFMNAIDDKLVIQNNDTHLYNKNVKYINPFIYYSQSHTIGIDIDQEACPTLKGLCIIDDKSTYTTVAQAIFRLRKLNMGHTVDFYCVNNFEDNKCKLLKYLKNNEIMNNENKQKFLIYQTIKSIIRKNNSIIGNFDKFIANHTEKIKHYFINFKEYNKSYVSDKQRFNDFFENILDYDNIKKNKKTDEMFHKINETTTIYELVYNMNTTYIQTTHNTEKNKNTNTNTNTEIQEITEIEIAAHIELKNRYRCKLPIVALLIKQESLINIKNTLDILKIQIVDDLYCLPNIFCNYAGAVFSENFSGIVCVDIHNILLLIPYYCFIYFKKYNIYDFQLKCINNSATIPEKYKNYNLFYLFSKNKHHLFNKDSINILEKMIIYNKLVLQPKITQSQYDYMKSINPNLDKELDEQRHRKKQDLSGVKLMPCKLISKEICDHMIEKIDNILILNHIVPTYYKQYEYFKLTSKTYKCDLYSIIYDKINM